jgi:hypothetical protein
MYPKPIFMKFCSYEYYLNKLIKRQKVLIPRYQFLTPFDGEKNYYHQILLKVPYFSEAELLSGENGSHTYKEECYIRGLFESHDEIEVAFKEMKICHFRNSGIKILFFCQNFTP